MITRMTRCKLQTRLPQSLPHLYMEHMLRVVQEEHGVGQRPHLPLPGQLAVSDVVRAARASERAPRHALQHLADSIGTNVKVTMVAAVGS